MDGPRPLFEHELNQFVDFLSAHLRPDQKWSIADEYPLAIHGANLNNVRVIKDSQEFLSAAVMKPLIIKSPAGLFKVAAIGSVVTAPEHRNRGLSKQILEDCLLAAEHHGCDFAILWTDLFEFYRKLGFELAGSEVSLELPADFKLPTENSGLRFLLSNKVDPDAILRLYNQHTTGSIRTTEDIRKFLQIPNSRVYTAWDEQNRLHAYAVEGKGADFEGYVHEWGGGVSKLLPLFQHMVTERKAGMTVIAPAHSTNLIQQLSQLGVKNHLGVLGMIKIINTPGFLKKIKKYIRAMGLEELILEPRDGQIYLGYREQIFKTDAMADLIRLVFGPGKASDLKAFDPTTADAFEKILPISMWVWGWDSV